jgi:K+-sensing histidine kinase KdpD
MADEPDSRRLVHDLRSPLAVIDGFAALLARDDAELTEEQRADYARRIRDAAAEIRTLLDDAATTPPEGP